MYDGSKTSPTGIAHSAAMAVQGFHRPDAPAFLCARTAPCARTSAQFQSRFPRLGTDGYSEETPSPKVELF